MKPTITIVMQPLDEMQICEQVVMHLVEQMRASVEKRMAEMVKQRFDSEISKAADKAVSEFLKKTIPRTNSYGEKTGESMPLTQYVVDKFKEYMQERVRADGTRGDSYGNNLPTRHQWLIEQIGTKEIVKVAQAEIEKVRKTAEAQVSAAVGNFIAQNLVAPVTATMLASKK